MADGDGRDESGRQVAHRQQGNAGDRSARLRAALTHARHDPDGGTIGEEENTNHAFASRVR